MTFEPCSNAEEILTLEDFLNENLKVPVTEKTTIVTIRIVLIDL